MNLSQQDLRLQAISAQISALHSQLLVIKSLDSEHSFGVENTYECQRLYDITQDLVGSARVISKNLQREEAWATCGSLKAFQVNADALKQEADSFGVSSSGRAQLRLECTIDREGPPPQGEAIPSDTHALASKAGACCFKAETSQYSTFVMQINAICNLCSELLFVGASLQAKRNSPENK